MNNPQRSITLNRWLVAASLLLLAANLRPLFSSTSVLLPNIITGLGISAATAGYLTTLPVLCMGIFAPLAPRFAQRIGVERTLWVVLLLITIGTALRGYLDVYGLFLGTAMGGAGIAMGNVLLPSLVKRDYADRAALMTGLYTMSLVGGAALGAAISLPLSQALGDQWSNGLAIWALPGLLALFAWAPVAYLSGAAQQASARLLPVKGLRQDALAWAVTLFMGLQSALAYCVLGWMAPMLQARGLSGTEAGLITSVSIILQVLSCILTPMLASRGQDQRALAVVLSAMAALGLVGMLMGPGWAIWPLALIQGLGQGGLFALALMLIVLRSRDAHVAASLSSMAQAIGYILAASGPLLIGLLYAWTGGFDAAAGLIGMLGICTALAGWFAGRNLLVKAQIIDVTV
ncbi:MFS transporter [Castellaniella sp.]|uniref:CynX/NimT family MFS transporter n=1 Tax=Castellaniella sp. TaxID=1955812 RepID=UPI002AFFECAA|nr:MFS transporter [Castellaniella sp.]